ncbi:MAG TPA: alpha/beta hydrolase, partial [Anaeromyxobacteraceae bacterium]
GEALLTCPPPRGCVRATRSLSSDRHAYPAVKPSTVPATSGDQNAPGARLGPRLAYPSAIRYNGHMSVPTDARLGSRSQERHRAGRPVTGGAPTVLIVPGLNGSGPDHWQSRWEARHPGFRRVEQVSWSRPRLGGWVDTLEGAVRSHSRVILVAHSLGCALVAHWAHRGSASRVTAALLVAPADVERADRPAAVGAFAPLPLAPLPFPAWVIASSDDPYATLARARSFAQAWGARFLEAGRCGHINVDSGHGHWPEGEALLAQLREEST